MALAVDWMQTSDIHRTKPANGNVITEGNRVLGPHPTQSTINQYFLAASVGHLLVSVALPPGYRNYWQVATLSVSCYWVRHNQAIGISIRW